MALISFFKTKKVSWRKADVHRLPFTGTTANPKRPAPAVIKAYLSAVFGKTNLVCPCGYHFRMKARQRIKMIADKDSFHELYSDLKSGNPLNFPGYRDKIDTVRAASGEEEAVICGTASIGGQKCCLFVMESYFMMGKYGKRRRRKGNFTV